MAGKRNQARIVTSIAGVLVAGAVLGWEALFRAPYLPNVHANYDVSGDGTRFVIVRRAEHASRLVVALGALNADRTPQRTHP